MFLSTNVVQLLWARMYI